MNYTISQELEAYCGKCKDNTLHLVTAVTDEKIEKVMCKICMSYHKFKKPATDEEKKEKKEKKVKKETKAKSPKVKTTRKRRSRTTQLLEEANIESATIYKLDGSYEIDTAINHKKFGLGVVKNVLDNQKIEVLFEDGEKLLVQNIQR